MTTADDCILAFLILNYAIVGVAKAGDPTMRNDEPREWLAQARGWRRRLMSAHANGWEAFAPFAAGVLVAQQSGAPQGTVDGLAMTFVVLRATYILIYARNIATARTLVWALGLACVVSLFLSGA